MFSPLEGIRVLDFTTSIAGPYCTLILASLGADVVKVEPPGRGDDTRAWAPFWGDESATFLAMNAGKRSLAVDVKSPAGLDVLLRLADGCDVFVQNMRPGLVERVGLGFDALRRRNPGIVYCSMGAFGSAGPLRDQPGYDPLMQAAAGIMSVTGEADRPPVRAGVSVVDQGTGMWAAIGVLAALRARDEGGGARYVETSLYETALNWVPYQIAGYLGTGRLPQRLGTAIGIIAPYEAFATKDGRIMIGAGNDRLFAALCEALELPDVADDPRFATNRDRVDHREELASLLAERLLEKPRDAWLERLERAGVPAAPVQDVAEAVAHEQTRALEILQPVPHAAIADLRLVAPPLRTDGERAGLRGAPPGLGEHTGAVLAEAGYSPDEIERLRADGVVA